MLTGGLIEPSDRPWSSPGVLVTKQDGGTRFCVDYQQLNDATVRDAYPLPRIDDTRDMLPVNSGSLLWTWRAVIGRFHCHRKLVPRRRSRRILGFSSRSCRSDCAMRRPHSRDRVRPHSRDRVLQGLRWSHCLVYLDDIISFGSTFRDVLDNLTLIFERLRSYKLQPKSTKCHLFQTSVPFLGYIVGRRCLECDPVKIEDVKSWPVPDCLKNVRQFLVSHSGIDGEGQRSW